MQTVTKNSNKKYRAEQGFSLVTVLSMGLVGSLWVAAAYSALIPLLHQASAGKSSLTMRTLAESAIDYIRNDITQKISKNEVSPFDDVETGVPYNNFELTAETLQISDASNRGIRLLVTVKNVDSPPKPENAFFDSQSNANQDIKKQWSLVRTGKGGWRIIEVRAIAGSNASNKYVYRTILKPDFTDTSKAFSETSKFFPNAAAFATSSLNIGSNSTVDGNLMSNGSKFPGAPAPVSLVGDNIAVNGDLSIYSLSKQSADNVGIGSSSSAEIKGFVSSNGEVSGFTEGGADGQVTVSRPSPDAPNYDPSKNLIIEGNNSDQQSIAPAPMAPEGAYDLGAINLSGTAQLTFANVDSASIPSGQTLSNLTSGQTILPVGSYKVSSINVSDLASIGVPSGSSGNSPVALYVEGASNGTSSVNIAGAGLNNQGSNGISGNFQIWYNGTRDVQITAAKSSMSIYAPNANIVLGATNKQIEFTGAIVGSNVSVKNAKLKFQDPTSSSKNVSGSPSFPISKDQNGKPYISAKRFKRISWQEIPYAEWISQKNPAF